MAISQAFKLSPNAVFVPKNLKLYAWVSANVIEILKGFAEKFQQVSVMKPTLCQYLISGILKQPYMPLRIKDEVKRQERITCSVGVGPNKLISKIASGYQKSDGLTIIRPEDVRDFLYPLNVSKIPGIGEKTTENLKVMGITKVEELANCDIQLLTERFGKMGLQMRQMANGLDFGEVRERGRVKSISRNGTFEVDTNDP